MIKSKQCWPTERGRGWRYAETRLAGNKKWISEGLTPLNTDLSVFPTVLCCLTLSPALYLNPLSATVGGPSSRKWRGWFTYLEAGLAELFRTRSLMKGHAKEETRLLIWKKASPSPLRHSKTRDGRDRSVMDNEWATHTHTHTQDKCVDFPKSREGYIVFIWVFINRSTVSQASKHTTSYSLAFDSRSECKGITIGKWAKNKTKTRKYIYILHYKYVKCTSLYTSTKDGRLTARPNRSTLKKYAKEETNKQNKTYQNTVCWSGRPKTISVQEFVFR